MPAAELADHRGELGDVGLVAGVGVPGQRDPAVAGDHQAQADQPQVGAFLLGLAALGHWRLLVPGADEGGEVGHVQGHRGAVQPVTAHDRHRDPRADLLQLIQGDGVHRVPEPAVIQRAGGDPGEPGRGRLRPPVSEGQLRARRRDPVQRRQRQVGAHAGTRIGPPRPRHRIDDAGHAEIFQQPPAGRDRAEVPVLDAARQPQASAAHRRGQFLRGAQILL